MSKAIVSLDPDDDDAPEADASVDVHAEALLNYEAGYAREEENILQGYEDLSFLAGNQWDDGVRAEREEQHRPVLTVNRLPQFCRQITGDIRQMRPAIKVVPVDSDSDPDTAKVIAGMVRYIENRSMAQAVYFNAADGMVHSGRGALRVETEYAAETTSNQEIRISPIEDGLSVIWDPDSLLPDKSDAMFVFVGADYSRRAYEKRWPGKSASTFGTDESKLFQGWATEDTVRVAEYWFKVPVKRTLLVGLGKVMDLTDKDPAEIEQAEMFAKMASERGLGDIKIEKRDGFKIKRAVISGGDILDEPKDWPGKFFPIVTFEGEELRIGRKLIRHGAVRHARDPQRMYNYYVTAQTEVTALQPKAPFIGTEKNFEEHEDQWEGANVENRPYLAYTPDPINGGRAPQRVQPPVSSSGISEGLKIAEMDLQATTGIYNASLGAASNETSGKAITARQREGDTGTYVYTEHFGQGLMQTARIIVDLVPHVYDTTREMRIIGDDGSEEVVQINQPASLAIAQGGDQNPGDAAAAQRYNNDVTVGAYDVVVEMGPSFNTRREEARDGMIAFLQAAPQMSPIVLDLIAKMQDWPLADEIRERLYAMLPPQVKAVVDAKKKGPDGQPLPPPPPPPPSPQEMMQQQQAAREQELAAQTHQLNLAKLQVDMQKIQAEIQKAGAELEGSKIDAATRLAEAEHTTRQSENDIAAAHASAAGKAGAAPPANDDGAPSAEPAGADPRVDGVIESVKQLDDAVGAMGQMLQRIMQAIQGGGAPGGAPAAPAPAANDTVAAVPAVPDVAQVAGSDLGGGAPAPDAMAA